MKPVVVALTGAALAFGAWTGTASAAGTWSQPAVVEPGAGPILSFGPTGQAALGAGGTDGDSAGVALADRSGTFSQPESTGAPGSYVELMGVAAPGDGACVALFRPDVFAGPVAGYVQPSGAPAFGAAQQLMAPLPDKNNPSYTHVRAASATTSKGEVVSYADDDGSGGRQASVLARGASAFKPVKEPRVGAQEPQDAPTIATDDAGGAFLSDDLGSSQHGCEQVSYRPPAGGWQSEVAGVPALCKGEIYEEGIAASGRGEAVLLTAGMAGLVAQRVHGDHLGQPQVLTRNFDAGDGPYGVESERDGQVTVAWAEPKVGVVAASGTMTHGFMTHDIARFRSPKEYATRAVRVIGDGVAMQNCPKRKGPCLLRVAFAGRDRKFGKPATVTHNISDVKDFTDDRHGNALLVWGAPGGRLFAAAHQAGTRGWSTPHLLSAGSSAPYQVAAGFGTHRVAIVAWSQGTNVSAAHFTLGPLRR